MRNPLILCLAGLLIVVAPTRAHAQDEDPPTPVVPKQVVSANPLLLRLGLLNGEYERRISPTSTLGVSGSSSALDRPSFRNVNLMLRYYPHGAALTGFYVGATAGAFTANTRTRVGYQAGYELGYAWLVGPRRNISLNLRGARPYLPGPALLFPRANIGLFTVGFAF
jgi:hypothetical protein